MKNLLIPSSIELLILPSIFFLLLSSNAINADQYNKLGQNSYIQCLRNHSVPSHLYFTPHSPSYNYFFFSSVRNRRALLNSFKPLLIFLPAVENHVQAAVLCSGSLSIPIRTRSGGHDYEGLSYTSTSSQFVLIDLQFLSSINVDYRYSRTAWVQAGASLGKLYHTIANKSSTVAFPAGLCPTVGVGGHLSGGGLGTMIRSFGLASDNVEDIRIVVASGEIVDRKIMGEDLFWALRGGGGASFGIILAYKVRLVEVPNKVTVFTVSKTLEEGATKLVDKWQRIAHKVDKRLFIRTVFTVVGNDSEYDDQNKTKRTVQVSFNSLFVGEMKELLLIMEDWFPELQLKAEDCIEMRWIESVLYFAGYQGKPLSILLERYSPVYNTSFKHKSDFFTKPIPLEGWSRILRRFLKKGEQPMMIIDPWGGRMDEISETETAFPHRKGNLYNVHYLTERWVENNAAVSKKHVDWLRRFYKFMTPYVSKNPRAAYLNYRDLDIGTDVMGNKTSYWEARRWGERYYKGNFKRLAYVKGNVDPNNLFRNEQSIPPLFST
ncbi:berberine bridge enzyme-like 22 [Dendrobium catenatum]|uniref:berberine bridge enzyme-like 22 n=1 Tax=Dendrobium catenatum TaxID=906689 RepID=UPI0009F61EF5|nr:berberine bridge enzyme-like 22 [Dendrobium catenatum]